MEVIKLLDRIEYYKKDLEKLYNDGKRFLITNNSIYKIDYNKSFTCNKVYTNTKTLPLTKRGRHFIYTEKQAKDLIEFLKEN